MRHFRTQCILRVLGIAATLAVALYLAVGRASYLAAVLLALFAAYQVARLIHYVDRTNREVSRFLQSIRYDDFSQSFPSGGRGASFEELSKAISEVMNDFREERARTEESRRYLHTVIQHVGIALISYRQDGSVGLINNAAKKLLHVTHLHNIEAISTFSPALADALARLQAGDRTLVQVVDGDDLLQLIVYATEFKLRGELYRLVSIQNIQSELENKEIEAWQKLTRVLTHEIMNSITPIASLASTANELLQEMDSTGEGTEAGEALRDVRGAVHTIERRSRSLLTFVNAYRSLTRIPMPNFSIFPIDDLFETVILLLRANMTDGSVKLSYDVDPPGLDLTADRQLVEQVVINLGKNALEAVAGREGAEVRLSARIDERGRTIIQVTDNGPGIVEEALGKIFIPFYTTKKEGSGIGLSLSRQIMRQHGGTLTVHSVPEKETVFTLRF